MTNVKLEDIVEQLPDQQVTQHLGLLSTSFRKTSQDIEEIAVRSNNSLAYSNLANRIASEIERLAAYYPNFSEGVAWCARNIFEINLIIRHIGHSAENMNQWLGQMAGDEKQILRGFLTLSATSDLPERQHLLDRLDEINSICAKHKIQPSGPFNIKKIAEKEQLGDEYAGLYKLFSKYVHPSSWLINSSTESLHSKEYINIFIIYSQIYSQDAYSRINAWLTDNARK